MLQNRGKTDRVVRMLLAIVIAALSFSGTISGTTATVLGIIAAVLLITTLADYFYPKGIGLIGVIDSI